MSSVVSGVFRAVSLMVSNSEQILQKREKIEFTEVLTIVLTRKEVFFFGESSQMLLTLEFVAGGW